MEDGYSLREIHEKLVWKFQPLDKKWTRPWTTPDPWEKGRLFRKKEDQKRLLAEAASEDEDDDYVDDEDVSWRVGCAKWRREERVALANARRRARELKAAAEAKVAAKAKADAEAKADEPKAKEAATEVKT